MTTSERQSEKPDHDSGSFERALKETPPQTDNEGGATSTGSGGDAAPTKTNTTHER
jgi:hypothetical protein